MTPHQTAILRNAFRSHWKPEPDCPVWLWCENNIVLSPMESADMAGPFISAVTPFIREVGGKWRFSSGRSWIKRGRASANYGRCSNNQALKARAAGDWRLPRG